MTGEFTPISTLGGTISTGREGGAVWSGSILADRSVAILTGWLVAIIAGRLSLRLGAISTGAGWLGVVSTWVSSRPAKAPYFSDFFCPQILPCDGCAIRTHTSWFAIISTLGLQTIKSAKGSSLS